METFVYILLSYVISYVCDTGYVLMVCKGLADRGLKLNSNRFASPASLDSFRYIKFVPYLNNIISVVNILRYFLQKNIILDGLVYTGMVSKMTDQELKSYENDSSALNAFILISRSLKRDRVVDNLAEKYHTSKEEVFVAKEEFVIDSENIIFYQMDLENPDAGFKIISSKGEVSKLSDDEQLEIIMEYYDEISKAIDEYIDKYYDGDRKRFESDILSDKKMDLDEIKGSVEAEYMKEVLSKRLHKSSE